MTDKFILLVEDNPKDEALTLRALRKCGILNDVVVKQDGGAAVDYLLPPIIPGQASARLPEVVLLDLNLPKISGLEVLKRLRADDRTRLLPVIVLTSSNEEKDVVDGYRFGANSYVQKPVEFAEFMDAVQKLGLYWMILNEPVHHRLEVT